MPRIDPNQLLRCLSVLLSPNGGIKSKDEVHRIASLMSKFSKKLVSKCIYVLILKTTDADLLDMFMSAGGWDLIFNWLSDGIMMRNWPLVVEMVELLLLCPVDIERLKGNNCPKLIKMLSKDQNATENVRALACNVVDQWLAVVKGACSDTVSNVGPGPSTSSVELLDSFPPVTESKGDSPVQPSHSAEQSKPHQAETLTHQVFRITIRDGKDLLAEVTSDKSLTKQTIGKSESDTVDSSDSGAPTTDPVHSVDSDSGDEVPTRKKRAVNKDSDDDYRPTSPPSKRVESKGPPKKTTKRSSESRIRDKKRGASNNDTYGASPEKKAKVEQRKKDDIVAKRREFEKNRVQRSKDKSIKDKPQMDENVAKTLSKLITPSIANVGKIPKKPKTTSEENEDSSSKKNDKKLLSSGAKDPKKYNISIEPRKGTDERPKTVKTFNSRFRSTGLEEPPPPPKKKALERGSKLDDLKDVGIGDKKKSKYTVLTSPARKEEVSSPVGQKSQPFLSPSPPHSKDSPTHPSSSFSADKKKDGPANDKDSKSKSAAEKSVASPPKPLKHVLQESDLFADALTAAIPVKDVKKKKRRISSSGINDGKKDTSSIKSNDDVKPVFKFYQDTLITSEDKKEKSDVDPQSKQEMKVEGDDSEYGPVSKEELEDEVAKAEEAIDEVLKQENRKNLERERNRLPKGVLVYVKKKSVLKKSVVWKSDGELEAVKYFELDETERVNVTKNFTDMKHMERVNERMVLRKLASEDRMEEKIPWRRPPPIDLPPQLIVPGKNSVEREIQHARERTTLQAIYFNRNMIPDSPAEPDLEIHAATEPTIIPLDDQTGNADSVISYKDKPWPEPKGFEPGIAPIDPGMPMRASLDVRPNNPNMVPMNVPEMMPPMNEQQPMMGPGPVPPAFHPPGGPFPGPFPPMGPNPMMPGPDWMSNGDGSGMMMGGGDMMMPPGNMGPGMPPAGMGPGPPGMHPGMMGPPDMFPPHMGGGPPEFMGQFMAGPPPGGMFPGQPGPQFPGPGGPGGPGPGGPPMGNDGPPQRPWFRPGGPGPGPNNNGGGGGTWRHPSKGGGGKWGKPMPVCKYIISKGFCRGKSCPFKHPKGNR